MSTTITKAIILSPTLYGSILFSIESLKALNKMLLQKKRKNRPTNYIFIVLNGSIFLTSSLLIVSCSFEWINNFNIKSFNCFV
jgi:hypothetical protein